MRGISPVVATVIMVAVALAAAVLAWELMQQKPAEASTEFLEQILNEHNFNADVDWCYNFGDTTVCDVLTTTYIEGNFPVTVDAQVAYIMRSEGNRTYMAVYKLTPPYVSGIYYPGRIERRTLTEEELNKYRKVLAISIPDVLCVKGTKTCYVALTPTYISDDMVIYYAALVTLEGNAVTLHV